MSYVHENLSSVPTQGLHDYVDENGAIHVGAPSQAVLVRDETDLDLLTDYMPGTIAYTAGYVDMWMLTNAGSWVRFAGEASAQTK